MTYVSPVFLKEAQCKPPAGETIFMSLELLLLGLKDTRTAQISGDLTPGHRLQLQRDVVFNPPIISYQFSWRCHFLLGYEAQREWVWNP